ncbi:MAG: carboxylate--amine ligase/circularly permuted type 2 ATP-grasp protein [Actinobacteria bacterium]|nr:carboxylate--amine ligase/circularly permuted type 2 ATP-grasp protein [Actinomycetota bacterium]
MTTSSAPTLGVEEELHLIDMSTLRLAGRAPALLAQLPAANFASELQRTTVEINTDVCATLEELRAQLVRRREQLIAVAGTDGLGIAAVGTAPMSWAEDFELTSTGRFARMQEDYRLLVDEQLICGTQVHVGVADRDTAVRAAHYLSADLPLLLALSASSPLWHGTDTGYASMRTIIWQRWPTAGLFGPIHSAKEYDDLLADLIRSGVITDAKMAYFDVRPSSHAPTLELRVCDACPLVDDAVLIAGLFRAMVCDAVAAIGTGVAVPSMPAPLHRAAMWRAARSGLTGQLLDNSARPEPRPAPDVVQALVQRLRPRLEELGDWAAVTELLEATLSRGNSASRQRSALAERGQLADVVLQAVAETQQTAARPPRQVNVNFEYAWSPGDEAFVDVSTVRPVYREVFAAIDAIGPAVLRERLDERDRWSSGVGLTFGVGGDHQRFHVDLIPRVVPEHEWSTLRVGLIQRARTLEMFLRDVYGAGEVIRDGVVPAAAVYRSTGWRDEARSLPKGAVRAAVSGFDLVRDDTASWRVLEDNVRVPSGVGYALAIRQLIDAVMPDLPRPRELLASHTAPGLLRATLSRITQREDPEIALLSDGADNSAWFEHRLLAERAGLLLAKPDDMEVDAGAVTAGGRRVDVIYLRLQCELSDLVDGCGRAIGQQLLEAATLGSIALANAPGNGVADDKAMYCHVPELIAYYLNERPVLDPVPTYRCADADERKIVLDRLDRLVTKPVDGYGGGGVLIGPYASAAELERRAREVTLDPARWIAQELVHLSTHPTLTPAGIYPRHVDLRAFVYLSGTGMADAQVADLALSRVAPEQSMVVNSSRGGGAKDTWILGPQRRDY